MKCNICKTRSRSIFKGKILNKYDADYYLCPNCKFLQIKDPFWLEEAYKDPINKYDTGILSRNISLSKLTAIIIYYFFDVNSSFLDYAGGYGIFTRMMRDIGFDFYWSDPYSENLLARGFEHDREKAIELLTSFESFEHFKNPIDEISKMLAISDNILFTTELLPINIPSPDEWWYYGIEHGQHISFFSEKTLRYISVKFNLKLLTIPNKNVHLLTGRYYSKTKFRMLIKYYDFIFEKIMRRKLESKTFDDMLFLKKQK